MNLLQKIFIWACLFLVKISFSQKEANIWYFGNKTGLDFNSGSPVAITNGTLNCFEAGASIADKNGNLLFYTDGVSVADRTHNIMPNGTGLLSGVSSWHGTIIVPKPGNCPIYYLFTTAAFGNDGAYYSEIDMRLNGGLGDIVPGKKNIALVNPTTEGISAVYHANGKDIWVVFHKWRSDAFYAYLVTCNGVSTTPVISNIGTYHDWDNSNQNYALVGMRHSPDGSKLVKRNNYSSAGIGFGSVVELFDFDNTTGILSNLISIPNIYYAKGVSFSPNSDLLYVADDKLNYQFDVTSGNAATTNASKQLIGTSSSNSTWDLQLGTDGKLYSHRDLTQAFVDVIGSPNTPGVGCNYQNNAVPMVGISFGLHFNNVMQSYFAPGFTSPDYGIIASYTYSNTSCSLLADFYDQSVSYCDSITYKWSFDDVASGAFNTSTLVNPSHLFSNPGTYNVKLVIESECDKDSTTQSITVNLPPVVSITPAATFSVCSGTGISLMAGGAFTYVWQPTWDSTSVITVTPSVTTTYTVTGTNQAGCTDMDSVSVIVMPLPLVDAGPYDTICTGQITTLNATGGTTYIWSTNQSTASISVTPAGTAIYTVTVSNGNCIAIDSTIITVLPSLTINTNNDTSICIGQAITLTASGGIYYNWSSGETTSSILISPVTSQQYIVSGSNGFCSGTDSVMVTIQQPPAAQITASDSLICESSCINFVNTGSGSAYNWSFGDGGADTTMDPTYCYSNPGNYPVTFSITNSYGCTAFDTLDYLITVLASPQASFTESSTHVQLTDPMVLFTNTSQNATNYFWDFGTGYDTSTAINPSHEYNETGTYTITLIALNSASCIDTAYGVIIVEDEFIFYAPNTFTPNNDGVNEVFIPITKATNVQTYRFQIFDRWGELIFETKDIYKGWDGTTSKGNSVVQTGTYVWKVSLKDSENKRHVYTGHINVLP